MDGFELVRMTGHKNQVRAARFSPDASHVLTASRDSTARLWQLRNPAAPTLRGHRASVESAVFSPVDDRILTLSLDGTVRLWSAEGELVEIWDTETRASDYSVAIFSPDGKRILCFYKKRMFAWNILRSWRSQGPWRRRAGR